MELKFKVWDKNKNKMLHWGDDFAYITDYKIVCLNNGGMVMPNNVETLLYSGLLDDTKNNMCEADIIECQIGHFGKYICELVWNNGGLFFQPIKPNFSQRFVIWEYIIDPHIIGNRYETPELLKNDAQD